MNTALVGKGLGARGSGARARRRKALGSPANVQHPDTIEAQYGMDDGVLRVQTRAAMTGYLLRRWSVDCTEDHNLRGGEFHLWLRNRKALYGVTNLVLAPGYDGHGDK